MFCFVLMHCEQGYPLHFSRFNLFVIRHTTIHVLENFWGTHTLHLHLARDICNFTQPELIWTGVKPLILTCTG